MEWVFHLSNLFLGQKVLDRERLVSWSIVMVANPIVGPKFRPFLYAQLHMLQHFHVTGTVHCLTFWNELKVKNTLHIEESDDDYLHFQFQHASFLGSSECRLFPFQTLSFSFGMILKSPYFTSSDNFTQHLVLIRCSKN
jgi:hypothetical protein